MPPLASVCWSSVLDPVPRFAVFSGRRRGTMFVHTIYLFSRILGDRPFRPHDDKLNVSHNLLAAPSLIRVEAAMS